MTDNDNDTNNDGKIRDLGTMTEMMARGKDYREEFELEMFGEEVVFVMKPIPDERWIPIQVYMRSVLGFDDEEAMEKIEDAREEDEEGVARMENIDVADPDEFARVLERIAVESVDGEAMGGYSDEDVAEFFDGAVGGYMPEVAYKGMEVTGTLRDVEKFRGVRGGN